MSDKTAPSLSENTETSVYIGENVGRHFGAAWIWGMGMGTGVMLVMALANDSSIGGPAEILMTLVGGAFFIGLFAGVFTLAGLIVIGLPVTLVLRLLRLEYRALYAVIGAASGAAFLVILFDSDAPNSLASLYFAVPGACAGLAAAWRWGRWREAKQASDQT